MFRHNDKFTLNSISDYEEMNTVIGYSDTLQSAVEISKTPVITINYK